MGEIFYITGKMMEKYIYVDYENMSNLKNLLPGKDKKYFFFIGANQNKIPKSLDCDSNEVCIERIRIEGQGKNALDFYIAYFIAKNDGQKGAQHFILSKDKGFDPLISYINKTKSREIIRRIITLDDIHKNEKGKNIKANAKNIEQRCKKVLENLKGIQSSKRPKSERSLKAHIKTCLGKDDLTDEEIQIIIDELYRKKSISKRNNRISYSI